MRSSLDDARIAELAPPVGTSTEPILGQQGRLGSVDQTGPIRIHRQAATLLALERGIPAHTRLVGLRVGFAQWLVLHMVMECRAVRRVQSLGEGHFGGLDWLATVVAGVVARE